MLPRQQRTGGARSPRGKRLRGQGESSPLGCSRPPLSRRRCAPIKPTPALVGRRRPTPGAFTSGVVAAMCDASPNPIVFALSNPTSKAECTAEQAYAWSKGKVVFTSSTKFPIRRRERRQRRGVRQQRVHLPRSGVGRVGVGGVVGDGRDVPRRRAMPRGAGDGGTRSISGRCIRPRPPYEKRRWWCVAVAAARRKGVAAGGACRADPSTPRRGNEYPRSTRNRNRRASTGSVRSGLHEDVPAVTTEEATSEAAVRAAGDDV